MRYRSRRGFGSGRRNVRERGSRQGAPITVELKVMKNYFEGGDWKDRYDSHRQQECVVLTAQSLMKQDINVSCGAVVRDSWPSYEQHRRRVEDRSESMVQVGLPCAARIATLAALDTADSGKLPTNHAQVSAECGRRSQASTNWPSNLLLGSPVPCVNVQKAPDVGYM